MNKLPKDRVMTWVSVILALIIIIMVSAYIYLSNKQAPDSQVDGVSTNSYMENDELVPGSVDAVF